MVLLSLSNISLPNTLFKDNRYIKWELSLLAKNIDVWDFFSDKWIQSVCNDLMVWANIPKSAII